jgi:hypothetical protein
MPSIPERRLHEDACGMHDMIASEEIFREQDR